MAQIAEEEVKESSVDITNTAGQAASIEIKGEDNAAKNTEVNPNS